MIPPSPTTGTPVDTPIDSSGAARPVAGFLPRDPAVLATGLTCGIDVGGTKIAGAVVDPEGHVVDEHRVVSPADSADAVEDAIAGLILELAGRHELVGVGIGAAGYVDAARSTVMFAPNIAWRDEDLRSEVEARVHLPVVVENDANAAAWGEFVFGAASEAHDMLMVTIGTGVGGGIVSNGALFRGGFGAAAEIGHLRVVPGGRICGCGNHGCLEQYASGTALVRETRALAVTPAAADLLERAGGDPARIDGPMITAAAAEGDAFAVAQVAEVGTWLGEAIASLAAVLDPGSVVVGGGVSEAGELLLEPVRDAFTQQLAGRGHRPVPTIVAASLGNRAGVIGAADLARR
ncbi:ROK family glucokinase [Nocardioides litoris]|uniref:ROK family glucokinase n=1 Tax=Nocardioides litoris TaxID=1926648 RepID=UPI00111F72F4|nr:ROK family glucokinase [Nocardioides litoris]